jgi:hypothetical protein
MAAQTPQNWDHWNGYYYNFGEGERYVVTFNVPACYSQNQRPSSGRRLIGFSPEEYVSPQGMPTGPAFERLKAIEARAMGSCCAAACRVLARRQASVSGYEGVAFSG